jgi:protein TonB
VAQAFADTQSRRPTAATVVSHLPVPYGLNLPAMLIKKKYQYMTMQFYDDTSNVGGVTSFKMANKDLVISVVTTLANKAGLVPRGEIFVRQRTPGAVASGPWPPDPGGPMGSSTRRSAIIVPVDPPSRPAVFVENEVLSNRVISLPRPEYPEQARASKTTGTVRVLVKVDERGRVEEAEAISGVSTLQAAAVEAAKQAIFEPVLKDGQPVKVKAVIAYTFQLN